VSIFGRFVTCPLVLWLQATAALPRLPMAEVPLGLVADWAPLASRDPPAMGAAAVGAAVQSR
jgi:hypothetical protein